MQSLPGSVPNNVDGPMPNNSESDTHYFSIPLCLTNDSHSYVLELAFRRQAEKRLRILEALSSPADLGALNSNRLEVLKGDRKRQYSIRVNDQWRICFEWPLSEAGPSNVEIVDYHA